MYEKEKQVQQQIAEGGVQSQSKELVQLKQELSGLNLPAQERWVEPTPPIPSRVQMISGGSGNGLVQMDDSGEDQGSDFDARLEKARERLKQVDKVKVSDYFSIERKINQLIPNYIAEGDVAKAEKELSWVEQRLDKILGG